MVVNFRASAAGDDPELLLPATAPACFDLPNDLLPGELHFPSCIGPC
jgi:hypothetical protein